MSLRSIAAALCLTGCGSTPSAQPAPSGVVAAPDLSEWKRETIVLPPAFAPEMKRVGEEELLFAPGMFDAKADDYFSYVFVLRYPNDSGITTASLTELLEHYYAGLMSAVAKDKKGDVEQAAKVVATVTEDGPHGLRVRLHTYDAFVTNQPIVLSIRLSIESMGAGSCVRAQVSPWNHDHTVWQDLETAARELRCALIEKPAGL